MKKQINSFKLYIRKYGMSGLVRKTVRKLCHCEITDKVYNHWYKRNGISAVELEKQRSYVFEKEPLYSIVVPLYKTPVKYLEELIQSVRQQTYVNWELCFSEGSGERSSDLEHLLEYYTNKDPRIRISYSKEPLNISKNTNKALKDINGEYIVFADHDDLLTPDALFECTRVINQNEAIDIIYSDEDKIDMGGTFYFQPHFKPDFSIDLLRSMNYFCHLVVVSRKLQKIVGVLNEQFDGAQDYDYVLRCVENAECVYHIPKVLYHWRAHQNSLAGNTASKGYASRAAIRAIEMHLERCGVQARVFSEPVFGIFHVKYILPEPPVKVSVIISDCGTEETLRNCLLSLTTKTQHVNYEILLVTEKDKLDIKLWGNGIRIVERKRNGNILEDFQMGSEMADGEYLLFLKGSIICKSDQWLEEMIGNCIRCEIGLVGCELLDAKHRIRHAGILVDRRENPRYVFRNNVYDDVGYMGRSRCSLYYPAVSPACMGIKSEFFKKIGGFKTASILGVGYGQVDFCYRVWQAGKKVLYNPGVIMIESQKSDVRLEDHEKKRFLEMWKNPPLDINVCYNPNLTLGKNLFTLRK